MKLVFAIKNGSTFATFDLTALQDRGEDAITNLLAIPGVLEAGTVDESEMYRAERKLNVLVAVEQESIDFEADFGWKP
jgi:hypothetical protein